jgi:hypothetical protein
MTDWNVLRKCPVCFAEIGKPCMSMTGTAEIPRERPHLRRRPRTRTTPTGAMP